MLRQYLLTVLFLVLPCHVVAAPLAPSAASQNGAPQKLTGCVLFKDGHFILHNEATTTVVELTGTGFEPAIGSRVTVTGAATGAKPIGGAALEVVRVTATLLQSAGGCESIAQTLNALTVAPASLTP